MQQEQEKDSLYEYDAAFLERYPILCGVDEAGRGPLCGPVSIGAVILDAENPIEGLNDSKKLTEKKRESLYESITHQAVAWTVVMVSPEAIDRMNIHHATLYGMAKAVKSLKITPDYALVDGAFVPPGMVCGCEAIKKGDATSACIAAASILAKVTRDRYMCKLDEEYPQYKLAKHKGYPTKLHYEMIEQHGIQAFYRKSFLTKRGIV